MARVFASLVIGSGVLLLAGEGAPRLGPETWVWLAVCGLAEALWIRLPDGRATLSMGSVANFAAALTLPRDQAIWVATLATLVVELAIMRKPLMRACFNAASTGLAVAETLLVLGRLAPEGALALRGTHLLAATLMAAAVFYASNRAAVLLVLALEQHRPVWGVWRENFGVRRDVLPSAAAFSLGVLLAHHYAHAGVMAIGFVLLPTLFVLDAHRSVRFGAVGPTARSATEPLRMAADEQRGPTARAG